MGRRLEEGGQLGPDRIGVGRDACQFLLEGCPGRVVGEFVAVSPEVEYSAGT